MQATPGPCDGYASRTVERPASDNIARLDSRHRQCVGAASLFLQRKAQ